MNRKELKRQYKETQHPMGLFRVRNTVNGKVFIGTSVNLSVALNSQKAKLRLGGHVNSALQSDWNQLGPDAFEFDILDTLTPPERLDYNPADDLRALEELWLDKLSPFDENGYHKRPKPRG